VRSQRAVVASSICGSAELSVISASCARKRCSMALHHHLLVLVVADGDLVALLDAALADLAEPRLHPLADDVKGVAQVEGEFLVPGVWSIRSSPTSSAPPSTSSL
jgi:hypothetical protein